MINVDVPPRPVVNLRGRSIDLRNKEIDAVLAEVRAECARQISKWGVQTLPSGTGSWATQNTAEWARTSCQAADREGHLTWKDVLREEYYEALAEGEGEALLRELIQVAAVAVSWGADLRGTGRGGVKRAYS